MVALVALAGCAFADSQPASRGSAVPPLAVSLENPSTPAPTATREPSSRYGREDVAQVEEAVAVTPPPLATQTPRPASNPSKPLQPVRHRVLKGDTVSSIADKYGVSKETVIWANKLERSPNHIELGQELVFPPVTGVLHVSQIDDTVETVARRYLADSESIVKSNHVESDGKLLVGQVVVVPGGRMVALAAVPSVNLEGQQVTPAAAASNDLGRGSETSRSGRTVPTRAQISLAVDSNSAHWAFIDAAIVPAQDSQRATGVPASVTIAQAIHESAWGASRLSREGHNYFGIKATAKAGTKGVIEMNTGEYLGGANVIVKDGFRAYNNMTESFVDHGRFFVENNRYAKAMANAADPRAFIRLIAAAGYATDPNYAAKVLAYMDKYNFYQYDI